MSRDLRVVGNGSLSVDALAEWMAGLGPWETRTEGATTWVQNITPRGSKPAFSLEGPLRINAEDLPLDLAAAVVTPQWLVEMNVPRGASETVWAMAVRVGRRLADDMGGVLFDPQQDEIVWPRSKQRRIIRLEGDPLRDVEFEWAIPMVGFTQTLSADLLDLLRRLLPEAIPRRFGTFEPLQHRLDDGDDGFHDVWREEAESDFSLGLFWTATKPVREGSVFFPDPDGSPDGIPSGSIQMSIDARVFEEPRWRALAETILDRVGSLTKAFAGRAVVIKHHSGGIPASELNTLAPSMVWSGAWLGLPDHPAWLTWLSPSYADKIDLLALSGLARDVGHGSIVCLADEPRSAEELVPWHVRFPADYSRLPESPASDRSGYVERIGIPTRAARKLPLADAR